MWGHSYLITQTTSRTFIIPRFCLYGNIPSKLCEQDLEISHNGRSQDSFKHIGTFNMYMMCVECKRLLSVPQGHDHRD